MEHESLSACRVIERIPDNRVPMMGEMHPDLMGTPRLELAFDQAVSSDFFPGASPEFLHTVLFVDRPGACADRGDRVRFYPCRRWFFRAKLPWIKAQYSRWMFLSSKMRLRMGRIKGFLANKIAPLVSLSKRCTT